MIEIVGYVFFALGCLCGICNWLSFFSAVLSKGNSSFIPYIGAILILLGMVLISKNTIQTYWWIAFLIEFTTLPMLIIGFVLYTLKKNDGNT